MYARCRRWPTRAGASRSRTRLASTRRRRSSRASWPSCGLHPECCTSSSASGPGRSRPRCSSLRRSPGGQVMPHSNHESDRSNASGVSRREVLCAGGAAAFSSLVAALLGGSERARAQGLAGRVPAGLPLYLGGEECFCTREWTIGKPQDFGALDRKALADAKVKVMFAEIPAVVAGHAFTTGHIPVASFEKVLAPTRMTVGVKNGIGCFPDKLSADKRAVSVIPDDFEHELAMCFNVKSRGLVVLTLCSHRGVVNTVKRAMEISGVKAVHAVMGGLHLAPHKEEYVRETVAALKEINPDHVIPMHCTGEVCIDILRAEMPDRFIRSSTGSRFIFGA